MFSLAERTFANGDIIPTSEESYDKGFESGLLWPDAWENHGKPGGPYVYTADCWAPRTHHIWAQASRAAHQAWMKGWEDGHRSKTHVRKCGVELPAWKKVRQ